MDLHGFGDLGARGGTSAKKPGEGSGVFSAGLPGRSARRGTDRVDFVGEHPVHPRACGERDITREILSIGTLISLDHF